MELAIIIQHRTYMQHMAVGGEARLWEARDAYAHAQAQLTH